MLYVVCRNTRYKLDIKIPDEHLVGAELIVDITDSESIVRVYKIPAKIYDVTSNNPDVHIPPRLEVTWDEEAVYVTPGFLIQYSEPNTDIQPSEGYVLVGRCKNPQAPTYTHEVMVFNEDQTLESQMQILCYGFSSFDFNGMPYGRGCFNIVYNGVSRPSGKINTNTESYLACVFEDAESILKIKSIPRFGGNIEVYKLRVRKVFHPNSKVSLSNLCPHNEAEFQGMMDVLLFKMSNQPEVFYLPYESEDSIVDGFLKVCQQFPTFSYNGSIYGKGRNSDKVCWWMDLP